MNRLAIPVFAMVLLWFALPLYADEDEDRDYRRAQNAFDAKLYEFAHRSLSIFSQKYPQSTKLPEALLRMGICSYHLARAAKDDAQPALYNRALNELTLVLLKYPLSTVEIDVRYWLGEVCLAAQRYPEALEYFKYVLDTGRSSEYRADSYFGISYVHFESGHYEDALESLDKLIAEFPNPARGNEYLFHRGMCLYFLGRFDEAVGMFDQLVNQDVDKETAVKSLFWLAECYYKLDRYDDAIAFYFKVKKRVKEPALMSKILYGLGYAYFQSGRFEDSLATFKELIRFAPESEFVEGAQFKIGENLYRLGRYAEAIEAFHESVKTDEFKYPSIFYIGECRYRLGDFEGALKWLDGMSEEADEGIRILALRDAGLCWFELRNFENARDRFSSMYELAKDRSYKASALVYLADSYLNLGNLDSALVSYRRALTDYTDSINVPRVRYHIGLVLMKKDLDEEAVEVFKNTYSRYPDSPYSAMCLFSHAEILRDMDDLTGAISAYRRFLEMATNSPLLKGMVGRAELNIGVCTYNDGKVEEALKLFESLAKRSGEESISAEALFQSARCLFQLDRFKEAERQLRRVVKEYPKTEFAPSALFELARHKTSQGDDEEAERIYSELLRSYPDSDKGDSVLFNLAKIAYARKDSELTRKRVESLKSRYPESYFVGPAEVLVAGVLFLEGKPQEALSEYDMLADKYAGTDIYPMIAIESAELLISLQRYEDALPRFKAARDSRIDEWLIRSYYGSAICLRRLGRSNEALEDFLTLVTGWPSSELSQAAILEATEIYVELEKYEDAIRLLQLLRDKKRAEERIKRIREQANAR
ncbi:MAG: hypothetical protein Kow00107_01310 [Planctomycetota bacterium]